MISWLYMIPVLYWDCNTYRKTTNFITFYVWVHFQSFLKGYLDSEPFPSPVLVYLPIYLFYLSRKDLPPYLFFVTRFRLFVNIAHNNFPPLLVHPSD